MTDRRDPSDMAPASTPSEVELDESERLLSELGAGLLEFSSDPVAQLLHTARGPGTPEELDDCVGFADHAVATASLAAIDHEPAADAATTRHEVVPPERRRLVFLGRALAAKAALITAVGVLGVAGAGAATGAIIVNQRDEPPSTTAPAPTDAPAVDDRAPADDESPRSTRTEAPTTSPPNPRRRPLR